jgi:hypothetical protein
MRLDRFRRKAVPSDYAMIDDIHGRKKLVVGKWHFKFNEGGRWLTLHIDLKSFMLFRIWFGPVLNKVVFFSIAVALYNPWHKN